MIRLPLIPTILVAFAVATMIGLGVWQLGRSEEKARLLAALEQARDLPPANLSNPEAPLSYRRAIADCRAEAVRPQVRAGQNLAGESGYSYRIPCRSGAEDGLLARLQVDIGWSRRPDLLDRVTLDRAVTGRLGMVAEGPAILTAATPVPPLEPSAPPSPDRIPDNHLFYALQWFFFALAAAVIYGLAVLRRNRSRDTRRPNP